MLPKAPSCGTKLRHQVAALVLDKADKAKNAKLHCFCRMLADRDFRVTASADKKDMPLLLFGSSLLQDDERANWQHSLLPRPPFFEEQLWMEDVY